MQSDAITLLVVLAVAVGIGVAVHGWRKSRHKRQRRKELQDLNNHEGNWRKK